MKMEIYQGNILIHTFYDLENECEAEIKFREFVRKTTGQPKDVNTNFDCKDFQFELYCQEE